MYCYKLFCRGGINVVSIGFGLKDKIDHQELACIVGDNGEIPHIFDVKSLEGLEGLLSLVEKYIFTNQQVCRSTFDPLS